MAAAVWDPQYAGMESGESFPGSWAAGGEGICLGNEKLINFAYWIGGEGYNSYPGRYGITSYAPVFGYVCNGTAYHEQTTLTVPYRLLRRMTEGNTYPIYIHSKHPGVCVLKRRIRFTTVIEFGFAIMFLVVAILWQQS